MYSGRRKPPIARSNPRGVHYLAPCKWRERMPIPCQKLMVLWIAVALTSSARAQTSTAATAPPADLDAYVAASMKTFEVPGIAVAIVKDGKVVVAKGYGVRKRGDPTAVDEFTMF